MFGSPHSTGALVVALVALAAVVSCVRPQMYPVEFETGIRSSATSDGLHRARSRYGIIFLKPAANFHSYDAAIVDRVTVAYKQDTALEAARKDGRFLDSEEDLGRLRDLFQGAFENSLSDSQDFVILPEPGRGVLRITGHILNLDVRAPVLHGSESRFAIDEGEMTLVLDVRDSVSGEALARFADRRLLRPRSAGIFGYATGPATRWSAVREIFDDWSDSARITLDELRIMGVPPVQARP
jgi:hypothetical protein